MGGMPYIVDTLGWLVGMGLQSGLVRDRMELVRSMIVMAGGRKDMGKTAQQMSDNYRKGMNGASAAYTAGVASVTESPMAKAATTEAMDRYSRGVQASITSGRRVAALQAKSLDDWKKAATAKASRLSDGAAAAMPKVVAHFQQWAGIYDQARQAAAAVSKDDPLGRVRVSINVMRAAAGKPTI